MEHNLEDPPPGPTNPAPPVLKYIVLPNHNLHRNSCEYRYSHAEFCQRLICFFCTFLFFLVLLFLLAFASIYTILNPKLPKFNVSSIAVNSLHVNPASSNLSTDFTLFVEADNPNKRFEIRYRNAGTVTAVFRGVTLCTGEIPQFQQPANNFTVMKIDMKGKGEAEPGVRAALLEGIAGPPPGEGLELHVVARVPVAIRLDGVVTIARFRIDSLFTVMLNRIAPGQTIEIKSSEHHVEVDYMGWR